MSKDRTSFLLTIFDHFVEWRGNPKAKQQFKGGTRLKRGYHIHNKELQCRDGS
jgi:hypothetical protein